jgi:hypothetical protein
MMVVPPCANNHLPRFIQSPNITPPFIVLALYHHLYRFLKIHLILAHLTVATLHALPITSTAHSQTPHIHTGLLQLLHL